MEPIFSVGSSAAKGGGNQRIRIYDNRVEVRTLRVLGEDLQTVRYEQVAGVSLKSGIFFATVTIETRGGDRLKIKDLPKGDARRAREMILQRTS